MITSCIPEEERERPAFKLNTTQSETVLADQPNCLTYFKKYNLPYSNCYEASEMLEEE